MVYANFDFEIKLWQSGYSYIAGVDEVGRGCFAGPVVVASVIFPKFIKIPFKLADSKLLTAVKRKELSQWIKEMASFYCITEIGLDEINEVGIGKATQKAFLECVNSLSQLPDYILIDAFTIDGIEQDKQRGIIKGDQKVASIAAASIIAKVYRDELMEKMHLEYPEYGFNNHKGYGTKFHREAIKKYGLSKLHRTSFNLSKYL